MTYPPSPIQAATVLRENATMLFAAESDVFASMVLSRQQLQPFCPVETMAPPISGGEGNRTPVQYNRLCNLLNTVYITTVSSGCQPNNSWFPVPDIHPPGPDWICSDPPPSPVMGSSCKVVLPLPVAI